MKKTLKRKFLIKNKNIYIIIKDTPLYCINGDKYFIAKIDSNKRRYQSPEIKINKKIYNQYSSSVFDLPWMMNMFNLSTKNNIQNTFNLISCRSNISMDLIQYDNGIKSTTISICPWDITQGKLYNEKTFTLNDIKYFPQYYIVLYQHIIPKIIKLMLEKQAITSVFYRKILLDKKYHVVLLKKKKYIRR